ncbi:hypothetical protein [Croceimicrobium hydrocarbonivorans]|uniref:Uncharacterized protein n=1 Tax=Croceimicrobium hydrocarbonivorans TaxID=2761580 RepID=A0A7H0VEL4_9FLAO|nr:hypothetical protein [Croceimicrobium hydrocarbonivorans]QNR24162.1 hypothetical protein H4K34_17595 [Croceimicrobium hydrocarbonivorans]
MKQRVLISLFLYFLSVGLYAQANEEASKSIAELRFNVNNSTLVGGPVYGRHFKIKGGLDLPGGEKANAVELVIYKKSDAGPKEVIRQEWFRVKAIDGANPETEFEFYINDFLEFNQTYIYEFAFSKTRIIPDNAANTIISNIEDRLIRFAGKEGDASTDRIYNWLLIELSSFYAGTPQNSIASELESMLESKPDFKTRLFLTASSADRFLNAKRKYTGYQKDSIRKQDSLVLMDQQLNSSLKLAKQLLSAVNFNPEFLNRLDNSQLSTKSELIALAKEEFWNALIYKLGDYPQKNTIKLFAKAIQDTNLSLARNHLAETKKAVTYLNELKLICTNLASDFKASEAVGDGTANSISKAALFLLRNPIGLVNGKLIPTINQYVIKRNSILNDEATYAIYKASEKLMKADLKRLLDPLRGVLVEIRKVSTYRPEAAVNKEELDAIRIGTAIGAGALAFSTDQHRYWQLEGFGYVGLKFYLQPVDKRLVNPYLQSRKGFFKSTAILVGFVSGVSPKFKDQEIQAIGNIKPMLALSLDINRYISLDLGAAFYNMEYISPLKSGTYFSASPIIGLSFDADIFNRFSALISSDAYRIPAN